MFLLPKLYKKTRFGSHCEHEAFYIPHITVIRSLTRRGAEYIRGSEEESIELDRDP